MVRGKKSPTPKEQVLAHRQLVLLRAQEAGRAFWDDMPANIRPGPEWRFQPFTERVFSAEECLQHPVTSKARRWFRHLRELNRIDKIIQKVIQNVSAQDFSDQESSDQDCSVQSLSDQGFSDQGFSDQGFSDQGFSDQTWASTLKMVLREAAGFVSADLAWEQHVRLAAGGGAQAASAADFLAAWAAEQVGERFLLPCLEQSYGMSQTPASQSESSNYRESSNYNTRSHPNDQPNQSERANQTERPNLRADLVLEIWGSILALKPSKLSVTDFCRLPTAAAALVRRAHSGGNDAARIPRSSTFPTSTFPSMDALLSQAINPQEALESQERMAVLGTLLQALPLQQQRALELDAAGWSRHEIAAALGCKEESVKTHLKRARRRLRSALASVPEFETYRAASAVDAAK